MKRILAAFAPLALAACSGSGTLSVGLTSSAVGSGTSSAALSSSVQGRSLPANLAGVTSVNVPVDEVDAHVVPAHGQGGAKGKGHDVDAMRGNDGGAADDGADEVNGDDVLDDDEGWQVVAKFAPPRSFDLMALGNAVAPLGTIDLPPGKVTQVRLKLHSDGAHDVLDGVSYDVIKGAVVPSQGAAPCDLVVPHSAFDPGLKIKGVYHAAKIAPGQSITVVVRLELVDSALEGGATCAYRLKPVLHMVEP